MTAIVQVFWQICLFRTSPEVLPSNNLLLGLLIVVNCALSWSGNMLLQALLPVSSDVTNQMSAEEIAALSDGFILLTRIVVSLAATAALTWGLLTAMGSGARTHKTLIAMYGTDIILTMILLPATAVAASFSSNAGQLVLTAMMFWGIGVVGYILHKALEIRWGLAVVAALFIFIFTIAITQVAISP